ncbi:hypothetical protein JCM10908_003237 [Rhodotorula pacifica]|uniref:Zn(II)2Cys6 transcription factor n=1 Tax=Rhodotorula pacifica TaxID=1495444 RepID=UPI003172E82A
MPANARPASSSHRSTSRPSESVGERGPPSVTSEQPGSSKTHSNDARTAVYNVGAIHDEAYGVSQRRTPSSGEAAANKRRRQSADESEGPAFPKKVKVLSCSQCKRRKIKCDRKVPCLACCKRGEASACSWPHESDITPKEVQPFALSEDLVTLAQRIRDLEQWAQEHPPPLRQSAPKPQEFEPTVYETPASRRKTEESGKNEMTPWGMPREESESAQSEPDETLYNIDEEAADELEMLGSLTTSKSRQDRHDESLQFFHGLTTPGLSAVRRRDRVRPPRHCAHQVTAWATTVFADFPTYDGPWSGTALGLDICRSAEELAYNYAHALEMLWSFAPNRALSTKLVSKYFEKVAWLHVVHHRETFRAEHEQAWDLRERGRGAQVDPLWLANYFIVLALALDGVRTPTELVHVTPREAEECDTSLWFSAAQRLMQLGNGWAKPQIRYIACTILLGQWLQVSSAGGTVSFFLATLSAALRTAQVLGLHKLTEDPSSMPPPDSAWPAAACSMRREGALRLFNALLFFDCMSGSTKFDSYLLEPGHTTTPPPTNLDWSDLSITDIDVRPKPPDRVTGMTFERVKYHYRLASRAAFQVLQSPGVHVTHSFVLEIDETYRSIFNQGMQCLKPVEAGSGPITVPEWMWLAIVDCLHSPLVRLHRPFMAEHASSREACLNSAKQVLTVLSRIATMSRKMWFTYLHALSAALCLFADLFHAIDSDRPPAEFAEKLTSIRLALDVLDDSVRDLPSTLQAVKDTGRGILLGLFTAAEARQAAHSSSNTKPAESFGAILHRLGSGFSDQSPQPSQSTSGVNLPSVNYSHTRAETVSPSLPPAFDAQMVNFGPSVEAPYLHGNTEDYLPNLLREVGLSPVHVAPPLQSAPAAMSHSAHYAAERVSPEWAYDWHAFLPAGDMYRDQPQRSGGGGGGPPA